MKDYSSDDYQDIDYIDGFCVTDIEEQKIDKLTRDMNAIGKLLYQIDDTKLNDVDNIKKDFYFLCDNNRYLIEDSMLLQKLETNIYDIFSIYEDKLFKIYEELIDNEDKKEELINKVSYEKIFKDYVNLHEKDKSKNEKIYSYDALKNCDIGQLKELRKIKDDYELNIKNKINEQNKIVKNGFKNIDDLNTIDELKDEYYKRIDIIMESNSSLSDKLSTADNISVFEIKEKLNLLQNKR